MLKARLVATTAMAVFALGVASAQAEEADDGGLYIAVGGGINWIDEVSDGQATLDFDGGMTYQAAVGYDFGVNSAGGAFRIEGEYSHTKNDLDEGRALGVSVPLGGDVSQNMFMVNVIYDFWAEDSFTPYFGLGIGVADVEMDATVAGTRIRSDGTDVAYRGMVGATQELTDELEIDLGFRFTSVDTNQTIDNSAVVGQLRYKF